MAKSMTMIKKKSKPAGMSTSQQNILDKNAMGPEPVMTQDLTQTETIRVFNWYNYMIYPKEAYDYLYDYINKFKKDKKYKKIGQIDPKHINRTLCYVARQVLLDNKPNQDLINRLEAHIDELLNCFVVQTVVKEKNVTPIVKEDASYDFICMVEESFDKMMAINAYDVATKTNFPKGSVKNVISYYEPVIEELTIAINKSNKDVTEAYKIYTKKELTNMLKILKDLVDDLNKYSQNKVKERKVRAPKKKSVTDILKYFVYQKANVDMKLTSIDPTKILEGTELFTFNTKYKIFTYYVAKDQQKLGIHRSSITNLDEEKSISKRIGRKSEEFLQKFFASNKIQKRKILETSNAAPMPSASRVNDDTILLECWR